MAGISAGSLGAVILFGYLFRTSDDEKNSVVEHCQVAIAASIGLNGLGGLGLYKLYKFGIPYDKIMHFLIPAILMVFGVYFLTKRFSVTKKYATIAMIVGIFVASVAWEGVEVAQDRIFGTKTAGVYGEDYVGDTVWDMIAATGGIGAGAYALRRSKSLFTIFPLTT